MHQGKIIVIGSPPELVSRYIGERIWEIEFEPAERDSLVEDLRRRNLEFEEAADVLYIFHFEDGQVDRNNDNIQEVQVHKVPGYLRI